MKKNPVKIRRFGRILTGSLASLMLAKLIQRTEMKKNPVKIRRFGRISTGSFASLGMAKRFRCGFYVKNA